MSDAAILVVDDDDNNRFTLVQRLKREGYENVTVACDGREALARLAERPFDLDPSRRDDARSSTASASSRR